MKTRFLKNWELSMLLALCVTLLFGLWASARSRALSEGLIRLHVLAVSDDENEQRIKLAVRDSVLAYLEPQLDAAPDVTAARGIISAGLDGIRSAAEAAAEGRPVTVTLSREYYPTRDYGSFALPAGSYESLRVVLGEGEGHNWWCVVFPPLCTAAVTEPEELPQAVASVSGVALGEPKYALRFRSMELWGELRGLFK